MFGAIRHKSAMNQGKANAIIAVFDAYRDVLPRVSHHMFVQMERGNRVPSLPLLKSHDFGTPLSGRHFKSVWNMSYESLESWREILKDRVISFIANSSLDSATQTILYRLNRAGKWFDENPVLGWQVDEKTGELTVPLPKQKRPEKNPPRIIELPVDRGVAKLLRHIVKQVRRSHANPDLSGVNTIKLDSPVAPVHARRDSFFPLWIRVSTLNTGHPSWVPLVRNPYFEEWLSKGNAQLAGAVQLHQDRVTGDISASLIVKAKDAAERKTGTDIGLDWGTCVLFATSDGRLLGCKMLAWLRETDKLLTGHAKKLNKRGVKWRDDRYYLALRARIAGYVANEIGRLFNILAEDESLSHIVVEKLDFRHGGLSKTMNRIIQLAGRAVVKKKLARLRETHGIGHTEVNSAYTSQECASCHHTKKANRRTRDRFVCCCCGKKSHADINGGRIVRFRRSDDQVNRNNVSTRSGRAAVLGILTDRHKQHCPSGKHAERIRTITGGRSVQDQREPTLTTFVLAEAA